MIKSFLFDIGNVLVHFDFSIAERRAANLSGRPVKLIREKVEELKADYESGRLSDELFLSEAMKRIQFTGSRGDFVSLWQEIFRPIDSMWDLVQRLHEKGYSLFLLSNTNGLHKRYLFDKFPIFRLFEGGVYSHEAGCMKPDDRIFRHTRIQLDLDPAETMYVDDLEANVAAGARHGFLSYQYDAGRHGELEDYLVKFGLM
jgi:putative hydrolase of the HAD superfamily